MGKAEVQDRDAGSYLAFLISNPSVEFLPLQAQEVLPWLDDATLSCDSPGSVDVISSYHTDCDASTLAFSNGFRDLGDIRVIGGAGKTSPYFVFGTIYRTPSSSKSVSTVNPMFQFRVLEGVWCEGVQRMVYGGQVLRAGSLPSPLANCLSCHLLHCVWPQK